MSFEDELKKAKKAEQAYKRQLKNSNKSFTTDSFQNLQMNLGIGTDNPLTGATYGFNPITRNRVLCEWMHRGSWLAGRVVDTVAQDMTRNGVSIVSEMPPDDIAEIEQTATKLQIWNSLCETIQWARLYGGALAVILIDGQEHDTPLRMGSIREGQFQGLMVLDRWMVNPSFGELITDLGPDLGYPKYYQVTANAPALHGIKVHHSRCIRMVGLKLPYWQRIMENMWGLSVLERLYDRMIAFDSASTGAAQLVYRAYIRTLKVKDLKSIVASGNAALQGLSKYVDNMRRFQGIEGLTLIDSEDEISESTHGAFGGLSDILQQFEGQMAGASEIPLIRLFGQSPAGFSNGDSDLQNYYDGINKEQNSSLFVGVTKIYKLIALSCGLDWPKGSSVKFNSLWEMDAEKKSEIAQKSFDVVSRAEETGLIDKATALKELRQQSEHTGIFSNVTDEMITEAENEPPPLPEDFPIGEKLDREGYANMQEKNLGVPNESVSSKQEKVGNKSDEQSGRGKSESSGNEGSAEKKNESKNVKAKDGKSLGSAGILFCTNNDEYLFLKRAKGDNSGKWGLPGGHIEEGETPLDGAKRECIEETGYIPCNPILRVNKSDDYITFISEVDEPFICKLNDEHSDWIWAKPSQFVTGEMHPNLERLFDRMGLL